VFNSLLRKRFLVTITWTPSKLLELKVCGVWPSTWFFYLSCKLSSAAHLEEKVCLLFATMVSLKIQLLLGTKLPINKLFLFSTLAICAQSLFSTHSVSLLPSMLRPLNVPPLILAVNSLSGACQFWSLVIQLNLFVSLVSPFWSLVLSCITKLSNSLALASTNGPSAPLLNAKVALAKMLKTSWCLHQLQPTMRRETCAECKRRWTKLITMATTSI